MRRYARLAALLVVLVPSLLTAQAVRPKGDRLLGLAINTAENGDFDAAFSLARSIGTEVVALPLNWDEVEPRRGEYDGSLLEIANLFYGASDVKLVLSIRTIDTNTLRLPGYLKNRRFSRASVINRFRRLLDFVFAQLPDVDIAYLSIGNEIDVYLGDQDALWDDYLVFFAATSDYARRRWPDVAVGTKGTWPGMVDHRPGDFLLLNQHSDVVMTTYYPLDEDFRVRPLGRVRPDLNRLVALYPGRRIALMEAGFPSGLANGSSRPKQKRFVRRIFKAWDTHDEAIELILFVWMHDIPLADVEAFLDYYGIDELGFASFLGTLGLRKPTGEGSNKPAFSRLRREAQRRGWPSYE